MMKKALILAALTALTITGAAYADTTTAQTGTCKCPQCKCKHCECQKPSDEKIQAARENFKKKQTEFEQRLKLSEKQKEQAKQIRLKGQEEMKPVMEQMKLKHQEAETVKLSKIAPKMQEEKLQKINAELRELRHKAREIRANNMKEFESILSKKQLKELDKMKKEGRQRFDKGFKKHVEKDGKPQPIGPFGPRPGMIQPPLNVEE